MHQYTAVIKICFAYFRLSRTAHAPPVVIAKADFEPCQMDSNDDVT